MAHALSVIVLLLAFAVGTASAQEARTVVQAAATAIGAANLASIQYSGSGWIAATGQSFSLSDDWPRWEVPSYSRVIDYNGRAFREEYVRRQGDYAPFGGGGTPLAGEQRMVSLLNGTYAWNMNGDTPVPQPGPYLAGIPVSDFRQLEILLTPHGFLKGAMAANNAALTSVTLPFAGTTNAGLTGNGRTATIVSYMALGKYRVNGTINDQNLVELVTTWIPNPVYGDMLYEVRHLNYRDFGGVKFPTTIHVHQGDPVLNPAHNLMEIHVTSVQANAAVPPMLVPESVRTAAAPPVRAQAETLADGVYLIGGGSHNSVAVEFDDFVVVIEAPLNEERSLAVIGEVTRVVPGKPIRYVVNTHHHFDHSGGLRTYLAQGATIVTHESNQDFYQDVMFAPLSRALQPDRLSVYYPNFAASRRPAPFETVKQKYVISDGTRNLDLHPIQDLNHAAGMLVAYLPKERILINADLYSPPASHTTAAPPSASSLTLRKTIERLKLNVAQHLPIHGRAGTQEEFITLTTPQPVISRADRLQKERDNAALQQVPPFRAFDNVSYVGVGWVGAWLVSTNQGLILLDAVEERYVDHLLNGVRRLGFDPKDIKYVVVTQAHADHYGGAAKIQRMFGARVAMGEADWAAIAAETDSGTQVSVRPPEHDIALKDGDTIKLGTTTLRFYATPGHTPGTTSVDLTVFDRGQPHRAFLLGGGAPAPGLQAAEQFVASVEKVEKMQIGVQVRLVNHPWMDPHFWDRADRLAERGPSDPHPMIAADEFRAWIRELKAEGQKMVDDARLKRNAVSN
jgi:glyoxylase-like metal-dependent hydrolase (beta-lactamase superfamily II)